MPGEADIPTTNPQAAPITQSAVDTVSSVAQAAAPIISIINPLAGALAAMIPKVGSILLDKTNTVPQRNLALAGAVLDTVAQATGSQTHAQAIQRVIDDPAAKATAEAALSPYFQMAEISGGIAAIRGQDLALIQSNVPWWAVIRSTSFWAMIFILPIAYLIVLSLVGVIGNAKWTTDATAALGGSALGSVIGGIVGYYFGGVTTKNKPAGAA